MVICSCIGKLGRAGNAFYQIGSVIGIAKKCGQPFGFPKFISEDNKRFDPNEDANIYAHLLNELPEMATTVNYVLHSYHWEYRQYNLPTGNHDLYGHFQSPQYFNHCIDLVRHHLTFKNEPQPFEACSLHWRAGDYTDGFDTYHPRMTAEYYIKALEHIPDVALLVFSDDKKGARLLFNAVENVTGRKFTIIDDGDYISDFKTMKNCKHHIIANSSFSAMAATLADQGGIVVSPSGDNWFGRAAGLTNFDIMQKWWVQIKIW